MKDGVEYEAGNSPKGSAHGKWRSVASILLGSAVRKQKVARGPVPTQQAGQMMQMQRDEVMQGRMPSRPAMQPSPPPHTPREAAEVRQPVGSPHAMPSAFPRCRTPSPSQAQTPPVSLTAAEGVHTRQERRELLLAEAQQAACSSAQRPDSAQQAQLAEPSSSAQHQSKPLVPRLPKRYIPLYSPFQGPPFPPPVMQAAAGERPQTSEQARRVKLFTPFDAHPPASAPPAHAFVGLNIPGSAEEQEAATSAPPAPTASVQQHQQPAPKSARKQAQRAVERGTVEKLHRQGSLDTFAVVDMMLASFFLHSGELTQRVAATAQTGQDLKTSPANVGEAATTGTGGGAAGRSLPERPSGGGEQSTGEEWAAAVAAAGAPAAGWHNDGYENPNQSQDHDGESSSRGPPRRHSDLPCSSANWVAEEGHAIPPRRNSDVPQTSPGWSVIHDETLPSSRRHPQNHWAGSSSEVARGIGAGRGTAHPQPPPKKSQPPSSGLPRAASQLPSRETPSQRDERATRRASVVLPRSATGVPEDGPKRTDSSGRRRDSAMRRAKSDTRGKGSPDEARGVQLPPTGHSDVDRRLQALLQPGCQEKEIALQSANLGPQAMRALALVLMYNAKVRSVSLQHNTPGPKGAKYLASALKRSDSLRRLSLADCAIGAEGGRLIAEALRANSGLQSLSLWNTQIGLQGAIAIADALRANTTLEELDMGSNGLGPEAAAAIGAMLRENVGLKVLDLRNNCLGDEGMQCLAEALEFNSTLQELKLSPNGTSLLVPRGIRAFINEREKSTGLKVLFY